MLLDSLPICVRKDTIPKEARGERERKALLLAAQMAEAKQEAYNLIHPNAAIKKQAA